jgi:pimeloyl-ACP methyl ester carboxylesterase
MRPARDRIEVAGATISLLRWGARGDPRIVLVHGGAAHAGWWSHLAPVLALDHEVVALDLSGHGDSDHREQYRFSTWAEEVLACGGATVVGHSMGGIVATLAAAAGARSVRRLVLVDTPLLRPEPDHTGDADATLALVRTYPTRDAAIARFRPLPPQPITDHALADLVAAGSIRRAADGWRWKYDPRAFTGEGPVDRPTDNHAGAGGAAVPGDRRRRRALGDRHPRRAVSSARAR